ncbi:glycosyltransferase family 2 protein [Cellulomonas hominis]|uniref:glycosyltransferase family 2 protein n=1 Tax=Cellulomonas hominis TaxID=156981 RepID=UPI0014438EEB|nr:glycosyltransferase family 2 protein [Cellulomonas hominis]NKY09935.1 glycosyltransferase family 2 protein [Cellulomonas hominis]
MTRSDTLVIVPAWNEEVTILSVLDEIAERAPGVDVLVVNDGSTDATAAIVAQHGIPVLDLPFNLGVGGAMRAGFRFALRHGYSAAVQCDADGQHDPRDIPRLVAALHEPGADIVIGARFAGEGDYEVRGPRRWAMRVLSATISRISGTRLTDTTSGFKAHGPRAIRLFARDYPAEYLGDTVEALVIAARAGLTVTQLGVRMRERAGGQASHSPFKAAVFLARAALALLLAVSRPALVPHAEPAA